MRARHLYCLAKLDRASATDLASSPSTLSHQASRHSSLEIIPFKTSLNSASAFCLHFHSLELLHQTEDLFVLSCDTNAGVPRGIRLGVIYLLQIEVEVTEPLFYRFPPLRQICGITLIITWTFENLN